MNTLTMFTDGGARGNPGPGAIGIVIKDESNETVFEVGKYIGNATNNEAEYSALIEGLKVCAEKQADVVLCHLDSELVVKQLTNLYKVKNPRMKELFDEVKSLEFKFTKVTYKHIPRAQNKKADALVNYSLDSIKNDPKR